MSKQECEEFLESSNLESEFRTDKMGRVKYIATFSRKATPEQRAEGMKYFDELMKKIDEEQERNW